jgi:hypothetical protein
VAAREPAGRTDEFVLSQGSSVRNVKCAPDHARPRRSNQLHEESAKLLKNKIAVIYGAGGAVGGALARAFARQGARVFLTGHTLVSVEARSVRSWISYEDFAVAILDAIEWPRHIQRRFTVGY